MGIGKLPAPHLYTHISGGKGKLKIWKNWVFKKGGGADFCLST